MKSKNALKRGKITAKQGGDGGGGSIPEMERDIDCIEGAGMEFIGTDLDHGMNQVGYEIQCMGLVMDSWALALSTWVNGP
ncbi:Heterogeneous nuclear ribonucleoprotein M [Sciurus carolinensis]|uniref:Heterogeneous nuclear ribonucleoprotein M n=1 Tax=Sciurus carolinensis TaxID=30640 RepID=A0AA41MUE7_SCICA|nr:Heterogeneous nuclear ribonucleoprotein M [Sciurus carolinensis]